MSLGWAIKVYRTRPCAGITQDRLAKKTGIPYARLNKFESGFLVPTEKELRTISKALKTELSDIRRLAEAGTPIVEAGE